MFGTTRGTLVPARKHLFALTLAVIASVPVAASADDPMTSWSMSAPCRGSKAPWNKRPRPKPITAKPID